MIQERNPPRTSKSARVSLIPEEEIDQKDNPLISYHIQDLAQLEFWMKKSPNSVFSMMQEMFKNYDDVLTERNVLVKKNNDLGEKISNLKKKFQLWNARESQPLKSIETNPLAKISTTKKFSDSSVFTDGKNPMIDEWLSVMRNKMKVNENWYSTKTMKKTYVRTRLRGDAMKHLASRFKKDSIKSFDTAEEIFDEMNRIFEDPNKRMNVMKEFRRLKQVNQFKEFHVFWFEFQRLTSDAEIFDELILLEDLKDKMSFDLQRILTSEAYKATDLHEFARLCQFTDQTLRNVESKSTRDRGFEYEFSSAERESTSAVNQRENTPAASSTERIISVPQSNNWRASSQASAEQINEFRCYNCNELEHMSRDRRLSQKPRRFVPAVNIREVIENNVDEDVQLDQKKAKPSS